jgi:hypothetical protein
MKNKKIEFEKLKNKLKKLFFKRLIQVESFNNSINLIKNVPSEENNEKTFDKVVANTKDKSFIVVKNIKNENFEPKNIEKINNIITYSSISSKSDKKQPLKLEYDKKNAKNIGYNQKNIEKHQLDKISLEPNKSESSSSKFILNKNINNSKNTNKTFELFKNYNIKLITKPEQIKNLNIQNIYNQEFEIDEKKITIPSKEQLKKLQKNVKLNKADLKKGNNVQLNKTVIEKGNNVQLNKTVIEKGNNVKLNKNKIESQRSNIQKIENHTSYVNKNNLISNKQIQNKNYVINFSKFNPTNIEKNKIIYALPAYQEGTGGPTTTESIGKIHKGEVILSQKESKSFSERLMKNTPNTNLSINKPTSTLESDSEQSKNKMEIEEGYNPDKPLIPMNEITKSEVSNKISVKETDELYKPDLLIKEKIDAPLFTSSAIKKQSPPEWRTTVG